MTPQEEKEKGRVQAVSTNAVLEARIESLRRDVGRLYRWVIALVGANLSVIVTIVIENYI